MRRIWENRFVRGLVLIAIMLFPVYWMVNVSLTRRDSIRRGDLVPLDLTLEHYGVVLSEQGSFLATSLLVGLGTVVLTLAVAAPARRGALDVGSSDTPAALVACHLLAPSGTAGARACAAGPSALAETVAPITDGSKHMFERHADFSRFCRCLVVHLSAAPLEHLF